MDIKATITSEEGWKRTISVTVPAAEVDKSFATATSKYKKNTEIPGFRKGKAPDGVIRERFKTEIKQDALEALLPEAYEAALKQLDIMPVSSPGLSKVHFEAGTDMEFELSVEIRPDVDITGYKGIPLEKRVYEITDSDVEIAVNNLREEAATTLKVERSAQTGDIVTCDLQKISDSKNSVKKDRFDNVKFELQDGKTRDEFLKAIPGMAIGEGKEVEIVYPADEPDPDLAGNTVRFRVWLKEVAEKVLPEANDEFAKKLGTFESMEKLRDVIRKDLIRRAEGASNKHVGEQIRKQLVEANPFDVPEGLLADYIDDVTNRLKESNPEIKRELVKEQFEPAAIEQFRWDFVIYEIAKKENLEVTDEDVQEVLKTWPEDDKNRPSEQKIRDSLLENRVYEFIVAEAQVNEVPRVLNPQIVTPTGEKAT